MMRFSQLCSDNSVAEFEHAESILLREEQEVSAVLSYAVTFLVIALIAAVLGLSGVAGMATQIAWVLFVIGIVLLVVNFLTGNRPTSVA
jgi:uncharacterized membrane protein YtjA (UPF0391 family)